MHTDDYTTDPIPLRRPLGHEAADRTATVYFDGDGIAHELPTLTPKRDADRANLRTLAAYSALVAFVVLLLISPAVVIGTWKALV